MILPEQALLKETKWSLRDIRAASSSLSEGLGLSCDEGMSPRYSWDLTASVTLSLSFSGNSLLKMKPKNRERLGFIQWAGFLKHPSACWWCKIWGFISSITELASPLYLFQQILSGKLFVKMSFFLGECMQVVQKVDSCILSSQDRILLLFIRFGH